MIPGHHARAGLALAAWLACASSAPAHQGGLDKQGCHTDRKSGDYHCHRTIPRARAAPATPPLAPPPVQHQSPARAFRNCDEARARGAAPVRRGDPGYGPHLDRDNDGVGCEPYRGR